MTRQLIRLFSLILLLSSGTLAYALGVGEARVKSSLNQPLEAEIELTGVGDLSENEILPGLATREEFVRAGVDRVFFLSDLRFEVMRSSNGKMSIRLTTRKPVREPFVNFLIEVIWPSGRLLREYALLIDPPVYSDQPAAPVAAPASSSPAPIARSTPAPAPQRPAQQVVRGDQLAMPSAVSIGAPRAGALAAGDSYGPIRAQDTLWEVAEKARPDGSVSPQQVMLAFLDTNPDAFIDGNINKLKQGAVLRVPSREQMTARSKYEAVNEVIAQNEALRAPRTKSVVTAQKAEGVPSAGSTTPTRDELKLLVAESGSKQTSSAQSGAAEAGSSGVSREELALTLEKLDQAVSEKNTLSTKVSDLEEQLATLQRLLTLKNDQLATLQEQMRANAQAQAAAEEGAQATVSLEAVAPTAEVAPSEASALEPKQDAQPTVDAAAPESALTTEPVVSAEPVATPAPISTEPLSVMDEGQDAQQTDYQNLTFIERIFVDPIYMAVTAVSIIVLMVLVWVISRNNAQKEQALRAALAEEEEEFDARASNFGGLDTTAFDEAPPAKTVQAKSAAQQHDELFGAVELDQVESEPEADDLDREDKERQQDVVAEADVYIAYGRLDQAATILEDALADEPMRNDIRLKLLEVYKEAGQAQQFERQYSELEATQDQPALKRAAALRIELGDNLRMAQTAVDFSKDDTELDLDTESLDANALVSEHDVVDEQDVLSDALTEEVEIDNDLEQEVLQSFDFDQVDELLEQEDAKTLDDIDEEALDLDLDLDLDAELGADESKDEAFEAELALDFDTDTVDETDELEADLDLSAELGLEEETAVDDLVNQDETLADVDLSDIELSEELEQEKEIAIPDDLSIPDELTVEEPETPVAEKAPTKSPEISDDILEEAADAFRDLDEIGGDLSEEEEFDFLDGADEASTKLDLARAYIDMGDLDGARDILEEVSKEGNAEQIKEAQSLLQELGD